MDVIMLTKNNVILILKGISISELCYFSGIPDCVWTFCVCLHWRCCIPWPTRCQTVSCGVRRLWKYRSFNGLPRASTWRI